MDLERVGEPKRPSVDVLNWGLASERTNLTKLSDIFLGVRSSLTDSVGAPGVPPLLLRRASIQGVRIRISVIAL